jgi:hypothetical protein
MPKNEWVYDTTPKAAAHLLYAASQLLELLPLYGLLQAAQTGDEDVQVS